MSNVNGSITPTASEEIQAAIETLTILRDLTEEGPFMFLEYDGDRNGDIVMGHPGDPVDAYPVIAEQMDPDEAALTITLRRTIDAQLAVLEFGTTQASLAAYMAPGDQEKALSIYLQFARAINGEASTE